MAAQANAAGRRTVLNLYRELLRLHKEKLPPPMKSLGDSYVRTEFKAVSSNKKTTEPQWREFIEQWQLYAKTLRGQLAIDNAAEEEWAARRLSELSPEQRQRLEKLREEAENARAKEPDG